MTSVTPNVDFSIEALFASRAHYGHKMRLSDPSFNSFVYTKQSDVSVIDLSLTRLALEEVWNFLFQAAKKNKRVLFVSTKETASKLVKQYALECGQYYVNHKWLGGLITNFQTTSLNSKTLDELETMINPENAAKYAKKDLSKVIKKLQSLESVIGGVRKMKKRPDIVFVIDAKKEKMALKEAKSYGITTIAVVDTNTNPKDIDYVIPGNDDSMAAIELYLKVASDAILQGIKHAMTERSFGKTAEETPVAKKAPVKRQSDKNPPKKQANE